MRTLRLSAAARLTPAAWQVIHSAVLLDHAAQSAADKPRGQRRFDRLAPVPHHGEIAALQTLDLGRDVHQVHSSVQLNQVVFGPEGLTFPLGQRPTLKMDYKNCKFPVGAVKRIVYTDDDLRVQENVLTVDNVLTGQVGARLKHFSRYAVMY